ncbi:MAG: polysaccharide biosynthesis/export family protein [Pseudomonadota bacterium]
MGHFKAFLAALIAIFIATGVSAQNEYTIRNGDVINVEVLEDSALNRSVVVLSDGRISFPFAGTLRAQGRTVPEIQAAITDAIASNFSIPPTVFVSVQPRPVVPRAPSAPPPPVTMAIYFLGEVNSPGLVEMEPGTRFLQAMAQSGGLTRFAADKRVQLRRTDPHTGETRLFEINYRAILDGAEISNNITLQEGDVIIVPERRLFE